MVRLLFIGSVVPSPQKLTYDYRSRTSHTSRHEIMKKLDVVSTRPFLALFSCVVVVVVAGGWNRNFALSSFWFGVFGKVRKKAHERAKVIVPTNVVRVVTNAEQGRRPGGTPGCCTDDTDGT
jgi:hypothetical protein